MTIRPPERHPNAESAPDELSGFKDLLHRVNRESHGQGEGSLTSLQAKLRTLFGMTSDFAEGDARETVAQFLQNTSLFGGLDAREIQRLARFVHVRHFEDAEFIYEEGRPGAALFLVRRGSVEISKRNSEGNSLSIATLVPPASFEELAAIGPDIIRWTSARASGRVELLALSRSDLEALARQSPGIANKVIIRLAEVTARRVRALLESQGLFPDLRDE